MWWSGWLGWAGSRFSINWKRQAGSEPQLERRPCTILNVSRDEVSMSIRISPDNKIEITSRTRNSAKHRECFYTIYRRPSCNESTKYRSMIFMILVRLQNGVGLVSLEPELRSADQSWRSFPGRCWFKKSLAVGLVGCAKYTSHLNRKDDMRRF